jgi:enamine deaminase RidA (YjgF/YER057c/UK114 family)
MIRRETSDAVGYSVVELNDVRHVFAAAMPRTGETLQEQAADALKTIEAVIKEEGTLGSIVKQAVFVRDPKSMDECRAIINDFYGPELPATSYIAQPPCGGKLISIEALGVGRRPGDVKILRLSNTSVIASHNDLSWIHCANIMPDTPATRVYGQALSCFRQMNEELASCGVNFNQVIRTWLYLGDITGPEGDLQRYQELNRARTDYFQGVNFFEGRLPEGFNKETYPASTGIGTSDREVLMSCIALDTRRDDIKLVPLENPVQTSAFDYSAVYSPESPKFARAMAVTAGEFATIFVSGTASITKSETLHEGDAVGQTLQTLANIQALISEENFRQHGAPGFGTGLRNLALVRVYIKRQEDYEGVRRVCQEMLGELPTVYAIADVCRPDLLVEIEGVAFARKLPT